MLKNLIFIFLFCISFVGYTQQYPSLDTLNFELRETLIKDYEAANKLQYKRLKKSHKGKLRKEVLNIYKRSNEEFLKNIRKKRFIFDTRFTTYIDSVLQVLKEANPSLRNTNFKVYVSKHTSINAMSIGNDHFIMHLGLFKYLENEGQFVSVLTHEIAHGELNHVEQSILHQAVLGSSKVRRLQAREIKKQKYNQYDKSFTILKNIMYDDSKKRRRREMLADSIGFELYRNTNFDKISFINSLKLMENYDSLPTISLDSTVYKQFFDLPEQAFKKEWLNMEEFSNYDYSKYKEKINKDSIKSHPEARQRIEKLAKDFAELQDDRKAIPKEGSTFRRLQKIARQEDIATLYYLEKYGLSVQLILHKLTKNPDDAYLKKWLGQNFLALYEAKKKYQLNRHVDRIVPKDQTKGYQQFLNFIWNLRLNELKAIGEYYSK
ncbi:M48 family metalloprotease [Flavobacteriaceae bacterium S356]|uniref:M48 family metalloprotease n=1 Tax=Asprobacillus argus TaxID=3076534 RepID=A0ABU3LHM3_9FLAO|nr:M48 family metalloprotease [Flavobacteriaceae bacterium S356]